MRSEYSQYGSQRRYGGGLGALLSAMTLLPVAAGYKRPGPGAHRMAARIAEKRKHVAALYANTSEAATSRQVRRAALRRQIKELRSMRKVHAMKSCELGGSAVVR